ncbi:MAG: hypothetical protein H7235_03005 [Bdellovibrionaceae bacterium]|nr:hypothetical protein [Pseudobdellovibrionaceae bacterium]
MGKAQYSKTNEFDPNKIGAYTSNELQGFLNQSKNQMKFDTITSIAKAISDKEGQRIESKDCSNCEESLLDVSKALSNLQVKLEKYEGKAESLPWGKIAIFLITAFATAGTFLLMGHKDGNPKKAHYYERKSDLLNLISILAIALLGVFS